MSLSSLKDLPKKHRAASILIGATILLAGATYYRNGAVTEKEQELEQKTTEGRRLQTNLTNATLLKENLDTLVDDNKRIAQQLVNPNQLGENLQLFYRIEAATGTKIADLRQVYNAQAAKSAKSGFVAIPYSVSVRGEYKAALNFVRRVEKSTRIARVVSASLSPTTGADRLASETVTLSLNLELLGTP